MDMWSQAINQMVQYMGGLGQGAGNMAMLSPYDPTLAAADSSQQMYALMNAMSAQNSMPATTINNNYASGAFNYQTPTSAAPTASASNGADQISQLIKQLLANANASQIQQQPQVQPQQQAYQQPQQQAPAQQPQQQPQKQNQGQGQQGQQQQAPTYFNLASGFVGSGPASAQVQKWFNPTTGQTSGYQTAGSVPMLSFGGSSSGKGGGGGQYTGGNNPDPGGGVNSPSTHNDPLSYNYASNVYGA